MKYLYLLVLFCLFGTVTQAQYLQATLQENGSIAIAPIEVQLTEQKSNDAPQLPNFPKAFVANQSFKNFRNVCLADLDEDGADDIIVGINDRLYAIAHNQMLWEYPVQGFATFPPSVGDVDADGELEVALGTWNVSPASGHLYLVDHKGAELPGWPLNFGSNFILNAPVLSDLDADGQMEIIACERRSPNGVLHIFDNKASVWGENWPAILDATPAVTPSVGDLDGDGTKEIVAFSTRSEYVFNLDGSLAEGWPVSLENKKHSYQSPILADMDGDANTLEIVGAAHGDAPEFFVRNRFGEYLPNWPKPTFSNSWTFSPPSILQQDGTNIALMGQPNGTSEADMLYAWTGEGDLLRDFPIQKEGGLEGIISLADLDGDGSMEMLFGSNIFDQETGTSFLHAYKTDGSGELAGFPFRPRGWTFMNGASLGDVNGDDFLDIVVLSYTQNFGAATDSVYINAYPTNIPYDPARIQWGTYKGSNTREGVLAESMLSSTQELRPEFDFEITPNPAQTRVQVRFGTYETSPTNLSLINTLGQSVQDIRIAKGTQNIELETSNLEKGLYFVTLHANGKRLAVKRLLIQ